MTSPEDIARGLSRAQKVFITKRWGMCSVSGEEWHDLVQLGISTPDMHSTRLTPLGLSVRAAVARLAAEEGGARDGE